MKLIQPLIHPKCFEDESPAGYVIRLAELNLYGTYRWLLPEKQGSSMSLMELYELLCRNPWTGFNKSHRFNELNGLSYRYIQAPKIKVCFDCIKEGKYWTFNTHAVLSPICVTHQTWKTDACPTCKKNYSWHMGNLQYCSCKTSRGEKGDSPSKRAIELAEFIEDKNLDDVAVRLDASDFTYKSRCDLFYLFALSLENNKKAGNFTRFNCVEGIKEYWEKVAELMFGDIKEFYQFLLDLHDKDLVAFKGFYRSLQEFDQPSLVEHKSVLINYIAQDLKTPISKQHRSLYRDKPSKEIWLPLQTVSRQYQVQKSTLKQLIENGKLKYQNRVFEKRAQTLIYIDSPVKFQKFIDQYVTYKEAHQLLGVTKAQLKTIVEHGYLEDICKPENSHLKWLISSNDIVALKAKLHANLENRACDRLTISEALSYYSMGFEELLPLLIKAVINGQITVVDKIKEMYVRDIALDKEEFIAWRNQKLKASDKISIPGLAERFGINQESMYQIVNAGLIHAEDCGKNRLNRFIAESEIQRFKDSYALLSKISMGKNDTPARLKSMISLQGVHPVCNSEGENLRQTIYRREDLLKCGHLIYLIQQKGDWWFDRNHSQAA